MSHETLDKNYNHKINEGHPGINMNSKNQMGDTFDQETVKKPTVMSII